MAITQLPFLNWTLFFSFISSSSLHLSFARNFHHYRRTGGSLFLRFHFSSEMRCEIDWNRNPNHSPPLAWDLAIASNRIGLHFSSSIDSDRYDKFSSSARRFLSEIFFFRISCFFLWLGRSSSDLRLYVINRRCKTRKSMHRERDGSSRR